MRVMTVCLGTVLLVGSPLAAAAQHPLAGDWVGGYQRGRNYVYVTLEFTVRGDSLGGTAHVPFQLRRRAPIADLSWSGGEATFSLQERDGTHGVRLRPAGEELEGTVTVAASSIPFRLVRVLQVPEARQKAHTGLYRLSDGSYVGVTGDGELGFGVLQDFRTGLNRSLFPLNDSTFSVGAGWYAPTPRVGTVQFDTARKALAWWDTVGERRGERVSLRKEDVRFRNGDVTLAGTLTVPPGRGPFPAVVFVHGSGPVGRDQILSEYFATQGIATLAYDKRGVGESGGTYTHDVNAQEFERLSGDALAAVALARTRPEIDGERVGLWGISQAGWIIALAAQSTDVAFSVVVSGPAVSLGEENYYSSLTGDDGDGTRLPESVVMERMRAYGSRGFDPRPFVRQMAAPSLWIFGDRDPSIPVEMSVAVLDSARRFHKRPITIQRFPDGNHLIFESQVGNRDEYPLLERYVPGYFELMIKWIAQQGLSQTVDTARVRAVHDSVTDQNERLAWLHPTLVTHHVYPKTGHAVVRRANVYCHTCPADSRPVHDFVVDANSDGSLTLWDMTWVQDSPLFFRSADGRRPIGFHADSTGTLTALTAGSWRVLERVINTSEADRDRRD